MFDSLHISLDSRVRRLLKVVTRLTILMIVTSVTDIILMSTMELVPVSATSGIQLFLDMIINEICSLLTFAFHRKTFEKWCCCFHTCVFRMFEMIIKETIAPQRLVRMTSESSRLMRFKQKYIKPNRNEIVDIASL